VICASGVGEAEGVGVASTSVGLGAGAGAGCAGCCTTSGDELSSSAIVGAIVETTTAKSASEPNRAAKRTNLFSELKKSEMRAFSLSINSSNDIREIYPVLNGYPSLPGT
jgi:hypothetical protein